MEITGSPELLVYRLVARELAPNALARFADEIRTVFASMGKTIG